MRVFRWIGVAVIGVLAAGCSSDTAVGPSGRFAYAAATATCGPADGPAIAIYFTSEPVTTLDPPGDYVRIYVSRTLDEIAAGKIWPIASNSDAAAWLHYANGDFENASVGYLEVASVSANKTVAGTVSLTFPDAGHVQRDFVAHWIETTMPCV